MENELRHRLEKLEESKIYSIDKYESYLIKLDYLEMNEMPFLFNRSEFYYPLHHHRCHYHQSNSDDYT
jgi:hypothetical protein